MTFLTHTNQAVSSVLSTSQPYYPSRLVSCRGVYVEVFYTFFSLFSTFVCFGLSIWFGEGFSVLLELGLDESLWLFRWGRDVFRKKSYRLKKMAGCFFQLFRRCFPWFYVFYFFPDHSGPTILSTSDASSRKKGRKKESTHMNYTLRILYILRRYLLFKSSFYLSKISLYIFQ